MGSERETSALAIVNHHSNRCRTLLAAFGGDRVGGIMVDYFPERMRTGRNQLCRRAHLFVTGSIPILVALSLPSIIFGHIGHVRGHGQRARNGQKATRSLRRAQNRLLTSPRSII